MAEIKYEFTSDGSAQVIAAFKAIEDAANKCMVAIGQRAKPSWHVRLIAFAMRPFVKAFWYASDMQVATMVAMAKHSIIGQEGGVSIGVLGSSSARLIHTAVK